MFAIYIIYIINITRHFSIEGDLIIGPVRV